MAQGKAEGWDRRGFLQAAAMLAPLLGIAPAAVLTGCAKDEAPSAAQQQLFKTISQLVLPATDTPGAGDAGAGAFTLLALAHGLDGTRKPVATNAAGLPLRNDGSLDYAAWLEGELNTRAKGDFLKLQPPAQTALLAAVDAEAFPEGPPPETPSPWRKIKGLILTGYYTSEAGAAKELRYELVPGRWDADIPLKPGDRAWSSDWTAVEFG